MVPLTSFEVPWEAVWGCFSGFCLNGRCVFVDPSYLVPPQFRAEAASIAPLHAAKTIRLEGARNRPEERERAAQTQHESSA